MEDSRPSRLQGAFRNYMNSVHSIYQPIYETSERNERCICVTKCIIFFSSFYVGYVLIAIYSNWYRDFFINLAYLVAIWTVFFLILFRKYLPCKSPLHWIRRIRFARSHPIASSEDQENQNEPEYTACQPTSLHNANDEQTANQLAAQQDTGEEIAHQHAVQNVEEEQIALHEDLPSRNIFGLLKNFCCPCSCSSTDDLRTQTEEYDGYHIIAGQDATEVQTANQLAAQHDTGEETAHQHPVQNGGEEQIALRIDLPSRNIFGLLKNFCCPCSCSSTASTDELRIQTEEYDGYHIIAGQDATEEQTANEPQALHATSEEISTRLQIAEQSLLQYLLSSNEEQELSSNEYLKPWMLESWILSE